MPPSTNWVLASGNQGKLAEFAGVFEPLGIKMVPQSDFDVIEAPEDGLTFIENALIKARNACRQTGLPSLADDSGLAVDALQGAPGIYSARYAADKTNTRPTDSQNLQKLLDAMTGLPEAERSARFVCALAWLAHADDPEPVIATGSWHGQISTRAAGVEGFGYDPIFYCPAEGCTAAEMGKSRKRQISHRAIALQQLKAALQSQQR